MSNPQPETAVDVARYEGAIDPRLVVGDGLRERVARSWHRTWRRLVPLGGISDGNGVELFFDGDAAFQAIFRDLEEAERRIWFETYIYEDDRVGLAIRDRLVAAARRGVEVVLLFDQWGSMELPAGFFTPLLDAGARVYAFNPTGVLLGRRLPTLVRDHRKVIVVDDRVGYCGGMNVSEDYAGEQHGRATFRDTHARLTGPCVFDLGDVFLESLRLCTGERWRPVRELPPPQEGGALVQVLRSNILLHRTHIQRSIRQTVRRSVERCWLTTPYFVPPKRLVRALVRAARRGVDVRVLTAGKSDVPMARMASEYLYGTLLKRGVRIYEMQGRTLHAKTAVVDGVYATVGSFNLDHWSFKRNLEVNVAFLDPDLVRGAEQQFERDLAEAVEISLERWSRRPVLTRAMNWLAYQLARV